MRASPAVSSQAFSFKEFRSPRTVIARFVARRTLRSAVVWAFIFGIYVATKSIGYAKAYSTIASRDSFARSFSDNVGLDALLGPPHHLETIVGYTAWNCFGIIIIIGAIWAFLLATKYFRGEEVAGRTEVLLTGQTTAGQAAVNLLGGLGSSLVVLYTVVAILFIAIGRARSIDFSTTAALFFALAVTTGSMLFMAIGAFTSQLMPTRSRASTFAAVIFGVCFMIRAAADVTSLHWLLDVTPLGWIEKLQPLVGSQPVWLLPIFALVCALCVATVWLANQRDLGDSTFADRDSARPRTALLNSPLPAAVRLTRSASIGWLFAISLFAFTYGLLTRAAIQALQSSPSSLQHGFDRLANTIHINFASLFLGVIFLMLMALIMAYAASAVGKIREDEAEGYLDNFLVRPVSRLRWLWGRTALVITVSVLACFIASIGAWIGQAMQHNGVSFSLLLKAGANMIAPVLFTIGAGMLAFGVRPRLTTLVAYGVLGWSFLISMISSGVNLNHWILDTSVLHQVALAPATNPDWTTDAVIAGLGLLLCVIGSMVFNARDLENE